MMITCNNGGFNNLSHWEAAVLAKHVRPKVAVPCHYDMFGDNSVDPGQFAAALRLQAAAMHYASMKHGEPFLFSSASWG
jgi:L-ascorbate 6-phosphate lactonase